MKTKDEQFEPELEVVIDWQTGRFWFVKKEENGGKVGLQESYRETQLPSLQ